ncbi:MAG: nucleotidyltransferase domain-containing protein [Nanoarchaeota archaeon]
MKISKIAFEIIELLLKEMKECYLREIAKKTDNSTSSISRQLKILKNSKILIERKSGKELMYSLNFKNNTTLKLCELVEVQRLEKFYRRNQEIKIILEDFLDKIKSENLVNVTIFGSIAKEKYTKESDIDILIITNRKEDFAKEIRKIHAEHEINLSIINMTKKELEEKKSEPLIKELVKNCLILFGYEYFIQKVILNE